jgi:ribonuclease R
VHQLLDQYFAGKLASDNMRQMWREKLPGISRSCTHAEQRADEAEREIIKLKMLRYLQERPAVHAQVFDAVITGVQDYGVFAQLRQFPVEGLVSLRALRDDAYRFDERQNALVGARSGRVLRLGTPVRVKIDAIDMSRRTVDFILRPQG